MKLENEIQQYPVIAFIFFFNEVTLRCYGFLLLFFFFFFFFFNMIILSLYCILLYFQFYAVVFNNCIG